MGNSNSANNEADDHLYECLVGTVHTIFQAKISVFDALVDVIVPIATQS